MSRAYLSLGSNIGGGPAQIADAISRLAAHSDITLVARAPLYRTTPVGPIAQDDFTNSALVIETSLTPEALIATCHAIEREMGRNRDHEQRWDHV